MGRDVSEIGGRMTLHGNQTVLHSPLCVRDAENFFALKGVVVRSVMVVGGFVGEE